MLYTKKKTKTSSTQFEIFIQLENDKQLNLHAKNNDTIYDIKSQILKIETIPISDQKLFYNQAELHNTKILLDCKISHLTTLQLLVDNCTNCNIMLNDFTIQESYEDIQPFLDIN